mgnify:FL=1
MTMSTRVRDSWNSLVKTSTNSLCLGDIISYGGLGGRLTKLYEVERFTNCYIIFKKYKTIGYGTPKFVDTKVRDTNGILHTTGTNLEFPYYLGVGSGDNDSHRMKIKKTSCSSYLVNDKTKPLWKLP